MILEKKDIDQLKSIGKPPDTAEWEMMLLAGGVAPIELERCCSYYDGITVLSPDQEAAIAGSFEQAVLSRHAVKFVAASGAASRMFKSPFKCLQQGWVTKDLLVEKSRQGNEDSVACFKMFQNLSAFAFFPALKTLMASKGLDLESLVDNGKYQDILENLLTDRGLGYSTLPKGLIPFHAYPDGARTAIEEHLFESTGYLKDQNNSVRIHFTVSPDNLDKVREHLRAAPGRLQLSNTDFDITVSVQSQSTDSLVLEQEHQPLRDTEGRLILYPSGHGALLENLDSLKGDIVFIRTIDNILPYSHQETVCFHKRVLGGYLVSLQDELFSSLRVLSSGNLDEPEFQQIKQFSETRMNLRSPAGFDQRSLEERVQTLFHRLNAPLRICGMVRDPGYPGGRPFWIRDEGGWESLQIVESAQVDMGNNEQNDIWNSCEFFNPADIVCGVRDFRGQPFELAKFSNPGLGFISDKTYNGRPCRVLERPGLWNGSMACWNTVFIEVPSITLRPVKTVLDLLDK